MTAVKPDELTVRLVDEGARLLSAHGPEGLSLRRLAAAVGTSTMTVYTRFGDKQGLLAAMHREGFRRLGEAIERAAAEPGDEPFAALTAVGRAYREAALASRHLYDLMFGPPPAGFTPDPAAEAAALATYTPLVDGVRAAVASGLMRGDPDRIALHLWAVAHGMVSLELAGHAVAEDPAAIYLEALALAAAPFIG